MVLQRKQKTSLLELFESHDEGSTLEVAVQPRPPTLLPIHSFPLEQLKKKRKREKKWKEASEEGEISSKDLQPQNGAKIAKGAQKRNTPEGSSIDVVVDRCPRIPSSGIFKRDGYVADALEQPLLLPHDMADLRTLKKHEVFLTLKKDLAMVHPPICPCIYFYLFIISVLHELFIFLFYFSYHCYLPGHPDG